MKITTSGQWLSRGKSVFEKEPIVGICLLSLLPSLPLRFPPPPLFLPLSSSLSISVMWMAVTGTFVLWLFTLCSLLFICTIFCSFKKGNSWGPNVISYIVTGFRRRVQVHWWRWFPLFCHQFSIPYLVLAQPEQPPGSAQVNRLWTW